MRTLWGMFILTMLLGILHIFVGMKIRTTCTQAVHSHLKKVALEKAYDEARIQWAYDTHPQRMEALAKEHAMHPPDESDIFFLQGRD